MINVLPEKEKIGLKREYYLRLSIVALVNLIFLSIFASLLLLPSYMLSDTKEKYFNKKLSEISSETPEISINELNTYIAKINSTLSLFSSTSSRKISENIIMPILAIRPTNIKINQISYVDHIDFVEISLNGVAGSRDALQSFKDILIKTGEYSSVDVPISSFVKKTNIDFNITLRMK